jgi:hypothetical protein
MVAETIVNRPAPAKCRTGETSPSFYYFFKIPSLIPFKHRVADKDGSITFYYRPTNKQLLSNAQGFYALEFQWHLMSPRIFVRSSFPRWSSFLLLRPSA